MGAGGKNFQNWERHIRASVKVRICTFVSFLNFALSSVSAGFGFCVFFSLLFWEGGGR